MTPLVNMLTLKDPGYPEVLRHIKPVPKQLFWAGLSPDQWLSRPRLAVVGSRKISPYGRKVTQKLVEELARARVVIISGLAFGVDAVAHQAALAVSGTTVAVLPTSLGNIYPASHLSLAKQIMARGGSLLSEYSKDAPVFKNNFIERNRIVSALSDGLLITEASLKSGTLHTARYALEQGKTVMAIPGNIDSPSSEGCNNLIKAGALPITDVSDVFFALGISPAKNRMDINKFEGSPKEKAILKLISDGLASQEELAAACKLDGAAINSVLTMLEIGGQIKPLGSGNWTLA